VTYADAHEQAEYLVLYDYTTQAELLDILAVYEAARFALRDEIDELANEIDSARREALV
jgi:hypothetical protein